MELIAEVQGEGQIFYRRRRRRVKRKSGNIDDFCRRWGISTAIWWCWMLTP